MITTIIIDFFDVIRDDGLMRWLKKHGMTKSGKVLEITDENDRGKYTQHELFTLLGKLTGETAVEVRDELNGNNRLNKELVDYIKDELRDKYKIGLISNSDSDYLRREIDKYHLEPLFDAIIISSEVGAIKPELEIFRIALERLGSQADEAIFIDDNPTYVQAAEQLGISAIVYRDFDTFKTDLEGKL